MEATCEPGDRRVQRTGAARARTLLLNNSNFQIVSWRLGVSLFCNVKQTESGFVLWANLCKNDPENVNENNDQRGVI